MSKPEPRAALGAMEYGERATVAVLTAPELVKVTLEIESEFNNPMEVNSVPQKVLVSP